MSSHDELISYVMLVFFVILIVGVFVWGVWTMFTKAKEHRESIVLKHKDIEDNTTTYSESAEET